MAWLQNIADRSACGLVALEGSVLFSEEGSKAVKKHFSHVLESILPSDEEAEEGPAEPESGNEADFEEGN